MYWVCITLKTSLLSRELELCTTWNPSPCLSTERCIEALLTNEPVHLGPVVIVNFIGTVCPTRKVLPGGIGELKAQKNELLWKIPCSGALRATWRERPPEPPSIPVGSLSELIKVTRVKPVNSFSSY